MRKNVIHVLIRAMVASVLLLPVVADGNNAVALAAGTSPRLAQASPAAPATDTGISTPDTIAQVDSVSTALENVGTAWVTAFMSHDTTTLLALTYHDYQTELAHIHLDNRNPYEIDLNPYPPMPDLSAVVVRATWSESRLATVLVTGVVTRISGGLPEQSSINAVLHLIRSEDWRVYGVDTDSTASTPIASVGIPFGYSAEIAVDGLGAIYVLDTTTKTRTIKRFLASGEPAGDWAIAADQPAQNTRLGVSSDGMVYIGSSQYDSPATIWRYATDGSGGQQWTDGTLIGIDHNDNLYALRLDNKGAAILAQVHPDGSSVLSWRISGLDNVSHMTFVDMPGNLPAIAGFDVYSGAHFRALQPDGTIAIDSAIQPTLTKQVGTLLTGGEDVWRDKDGNWYEMARGYPSSPIYKLAPDGALLECWHVGGGLGSQGLKMTLGSNGSLYVLTGEGVNRYAPAGLPVLP